MRTFDLSPLFRSSVGFDHLGRLLDAASRLDEQTVSYPPYNIEKLGDDNYRITMAVAGFSEADLDVTVQDHSLVVSGRSPKEDGKTQYLHRGIARRAFERRFQLADHIRVSGASVSNGMLHIELVREVPESLRPRSIPIASGAPARVTVEQKAA